MLDTLLVRPRVFVGSCLAIVVVALAVHPSWARSIGADVWNVPALNEQVRELAVEEERLGDEGDTMLRRIAVKESITADLIAGRLALADATARFDELSAARPSHRAVVLESYPGATDREKFARNVISYALARVEPSKCAELSSRLEGELRQMLAASAAH